MAETVTLVIKDVLTCDNTVLECRTGGPSDLEGGCWNKFRLNSLTKGERSLLQ